MKRNDRKKVEKKKEIGKKVELNLEVLTLFSLTL